MAELKKEQQEEEFKKRFGDSPTFNEETCIELLKFCSDAEDITRWNKWREENPKTNILLDEADLKGATLTRANLDNAMMIKAHLEGAFMPYAHLNNADLTGAFLQGVDLGHAILEGADLNGAHLEKASIDMQTNPHNNNLDLDDVEKDKQACLNNANLKGAVLANANLEGANLESAIFENADLGEANLKDAKLINTKLKNANLRNANLTNANLWEVDLKDAKLLYAILEDTSISGGDDNKPNLKNANFTGATVNGKTIIQNCNIDEKTNFSIVGLDSARVEPKLLAALKTNIRRIEWEKYYVEHGKIKTAHISLFWSLSDYGSNTTDIVETFTLTSLFFTIVYLVIAFLNQDPAVLSNFNITGVWWLNVISAFCFAVSTMVTLGFGGINVIIQESAPLGTAFALAAVTFNLIAGYFILAVLVTRLGILFQSLAPEQKIKKE